MMRFQFRLLHVKLLIDYYQIVTSLCDDFKDNDSLVKDTLDALRVVYTDTDLWPSGYFHDDHQMDDFFDRIDNTLSEILRDYYPDDTEINLENIHFESLKRDGTLTFTVNDPVFLSERELNMIKFERGKEVSFELYPSSLYGETFKRVTVTDPAVSATTAAFYNFDPEREHAKVYDTLPPGVPRNAGDLDYVILRMPDGQLRPVAIPWIVEKSIVVHNVARGYDVFVGDAGSNEDAERIRAALVGQGFTKINITPRD